MPDAHGYFNIIAMLYTHKTAEDTCYFKFCNEINKSETAGAFHAAILAVVKFNQFFW